MHARRLLGMVAAGSVMLRACAALGTSGGTAVKAPSTLTFATLADPDTLDPMRQTTTSVSNIVAMIVESLATVDQTGKVQPSLATAWQQAPDGLSWVFTLRSGVSFTDCTPLDAAAVKADL